MNLNIDLLKAIFSATFWASVFLAYVLFRRREAAGAKYLSTIMFFCALWIGGILLGLTSKSVESKNAGMTLVYLGSVFVPVLLMAYVFDFLGIKKWLTWKLFLPLSLFPLLILVFSIFPATQHLLWSIESINPANNAATHANGAFYYPWIIYVYALYLFSIVFLFSKQNILSSLKRRHARIFFLAVLIPMAIHLFFLLQPTPSNLVNPTPIGIALAIAIVFFGIYNFQAFSLVPVARQKVIETMNDAVLVIDKYSRIAMYNEAFRALFFMEKQKLAGKHLENLLPDFEKVIRNFDTQQDSAMQEYVLGINTFDLSVKPIYKAKNKIDGKVVVLHDISHQRQVVDQLNLSNIQLQNQLSFNESLIEDLKAFSYTVAHNLKDPLNNIIGFCELVNKEAISAENKQQFIRQILASGFKMDRIIDELLLLSGISIKDIIIEYFDIKPTIDEALKRHKVDIVETKAVIHLPEKWPLVQGHAPWIEEVWSNLISNALKYGGNPPVLTFGFEERSNDQVFYLNDNGNGLSPDQIDQLFQPFTSLDNSKDTGHGLGLSIVKRIVNKLNGTVWAKSSNKKGEGVTFCFTLPVK